MTTQEQAFRTYYGLMADEELLRNVANKQSFVELAQTLMLEEAGRRRLEIPAEVRPERQSQPAGPLSWLENALGRLFLINGVLWPSLLET